MPLSRRAQLQKTFIFVSFLVCCLGASFLCTAFATEYWFKSKARSYISSSSGEVHFGLFKGKRDTFKLLRIVHTLSVVCSDEYCMYSCADTKAHREEQLQQVLDNQSNVTLEFCVNEANVEETVGGLGRGGGGGVVVSQLDPLAVEDPSHVPWAGPLAWMMGMMHDGRETLSQGDGKDGGMKTFLAEDGNVAYVKDGRKTDSDPDENKGIDREVNEEIVGHDENKRDEYYDYTDKESLQQRQQPYVATETTEYPTSSTEFPLVQPDDLMDYGLWVGTVVCLSLGLLMAVVGALFAVINTATTPVEAITGVPGLYLWNGLASLFDMLCVILWAVQFHKHLTNNVLLYDSSNGWTTEGMEVFGYSFWLVVAAIFVHVVNLVIIFIGTYEPKVKEQLEPPESKSGNIMLY